MDKERLERFTSGDDDVRMYTLEELLKNNKKEEKQPIKASAEPQPKKITDFSINQPADDEL